MNHLICPISTQRIDSNVSRITIFLNVVLMVVYIITKNPIFLYATTIDYFIRAFFKVEWSPIRYIAISLAKGFQLGSKPIDLAQKIFASRLGFLCAIAGLILFYTGSFTASIVITAFLMTLSTLDSVGNLCVGCLIYNYIIYPFYKDRLNA
jgi:Domain of unknown function (DUF4395)